MCPCSHTSHCSTGTCSDKIGDLGNQTIHDIALLHGYDVTKVAGPSVTHTEPSSAASPSENERFKSEPGTFELSRARDDSAAAAALQLQKRSRTPEVLDFQSLHLYKDIKSEVKGDAVILTMKRQSSVDDDGDDGGGDEESDKDDASGMVGRHDVPNQTIGSVDAADDAVNSPRRQTFHKEPRQQDATVRRDLVAPSGGSSIGATVWDNRQHISIFPQIAQALKTSLGHIVSHPPAPPISFSAHCRSSFLFRIKFCHPPLISPTTTLTNSIFSRRNIPPCPSSRLPCAVLSPLYSPCTNPLPYLPLHVTSPPVASHCISIAASDTARFSPAICIAVAAPASPSAAADLFRGGRRGEVRLLSGVTVLHLAALHGVDEVCCMCMYACVCTFIVC